MNKSGYSAETIEVRRIIRIHLAERDMTMADFAKDIGVSGAYLSKVMNGKSPPSDTVLSAIGYERVVSVSYVPVKKGL